MEQPIFKTYTLTLRGRQVAITRPWVMGIINVTPDSFYADSRCADEQALAERVSRAVAEHADVIDIGACSTRPGLPSVTAQEEIRRLKSAMSVVRRIAPDVVTSVDTFRADVARFAVEELGVDMVNDVSGGEIDPDMMPTMAQLKVPYILMHMRGTPETMAELTHYDNLLEEVKGFLEARLNDLRMRGVNDVIIDPGYGFAKTLDQNYELLARLSEFHSLNAPVLVGVSRKSMIYRYFGFTADDALNGTTVLNTIALLQGAHILRVHDVKAAVEARELVGKTYNLYNDINEKND